MKSLSISRKNTLTQHTHIHNLPIKKGLSEVKMSLVSCVELCQCICDLRVKTALFLFLFSLTLLPHFFIYLIAQEKEVLV